MKIGTAIGDAIAHIPVLGRFTEAYRTGSRVRRRRRTGGLARTPPLSVAAWLDARRTATRPLNCFPTPSAGPRLSIVTDAIDSRSLFGGVGTSLVLGALAANRMQAALRLVTRTVPPDAGAVGRVLTANGVRLDSPLEVVHVPHERGHSLPIADDDMFVSTSWWTTRSLLTTMHRDRVAYLLQEDERMFYPAGDDRLQCEQTLHEPGVLTIVNSRLLLNHLLHGPEPVPGLADRAICFEPAFPARVAMAARPKPSGKRRLFFYARPQHSRNLFCCGIEALSDAVADGTLHPDAWEICLVGRDIPDLVFPRGLRPHRFEGLSWSEYQRLVHAMDAGFVLMDSPHPSYPPLDLAASGAAVLTNSRANKQDLSHYSANIAVAPLTREGLRSGLAALAMRACDDKTREAAVREDRICRDWSEALGEVVERVASHFGCNPMPPVSRRRGAGTAGERPAALDAGLPSMGSAAD